MRSISVKHRSTAIVDDYPFHNSFSSAILPLMEDFPPEESIGPTNVTGIHTPWQWQSDNHQIIKLKGYLINEIDKHGWGASIEEYTSGMRNVASIKYKCRDLWGNIYHKGDFAHPHGHEPCQFSFAYFLKTKWYDSPLVFTESGKRIRPKEGRYVAFPSYLIHHVPKHRYNGTRVTLSGKLRVKDT